MSETEASFKAIYIGIKMTVVPLSTGIEVGWEIRMTTTIVPGCSRFSLHLLHALGASDLDRVQPLEAWQHFVDIWFITNRVVA